MKRHQVVLAGVVFTVAGLVVAQNLLGQAAGRAKSAPTASVSAPVTVSPPEPPPTPSVSASAPEPAEKLLYTFSTEFKNDEKHQGRAANIKLLAEKLNGTRLKPGETFSFNKAVGPRTLEAGFKEAPTYFLGEVQPGVGGGTCQVSSTLYAAALHTNLDVLDRRPHSRKSSYIEVGLDATVNYPEECWDTDKPDQRVCYDLVLKNPYDFDILFKLGVGQSATPGKGLLMVWVQGTGEVPKVTTVWKGYGTPPFKTRYRQISYWKDDRKQLKQSGQPGLRGARIVTIEWPDGRTETKEVYSKYQPVPEVWHVGVNFEKPPEEPEDGDDR